MSFSETSDSRRHDRLEYKQWIEALVIDQASLSATAHIQSPAVDLSDVGVGVLVAEPLEVGAPVLIRLRSRVDGTTRDAFGFVRVAVKAGNWFRSGIEFDSPPAWAAGLTFDSVTRKAA